MRSIINKDDVISVIKSFVEMNDGDDATVEMILGIGAEILDVSDDTMNELICD